MFPHLFLDQLNSDMDALNSDTDACATDSKLEPDWPIFN
jgi:hypothetical protein